MSVPAQNGPTWRTSQFSRASPSPSPVVADGKPRPVSAIFSSPVTSPLAGGHARTQSFSPLGMVTQGPGRSNSVRKRSNSYRSGSPATGTFTPTFIKSEEMQKPMPMVNGIEGENDFSGKKYVWLKDSAIAFVKGWILEELSNGKIRVQCDDGSVCSPPQPSLMNIDHCSNETSIRLM